MTDPNKLTLRIQVSIEQPHSGYGRLQIVDEIHLDARGFMEICKLLGEFQSLADKLREKERAG